MSIEGSLSLRKRWHGPLRPEARDGPGSGQATKAVHEGVVDAPQAKATPELAPKHSSPSNPAGAAVKIPENRARLLKLDLEKRYGVRVTASMPAWAWLMRRAGSLRERFSRRAGGQAPREHATGAAYKSDIATLA